MQKLNASIAAIPLPRRMAHAPISPTGYPVPWFVAWLDGVPDFRVADTAKIIRAVRAELCWLCGQTVGRHKAFVIGPMCAVNRVSSEPPSHRDCAEYALCACPFLTRPRMRRNEADRPAEATPPSGIMIARNPGVCLLWVTRSFERFRPPGGGVLFRIGPPDHVQAYCEGRPATRAELMASVESGLPLLAADASGPDDLAALDRQVRAAMPIIERSVAA